MEDNQPPAASTSTSYEDASWYSYLTYSWINPLVETGVERQVRLDDTPRLAKSEDALVNTRLLLGDLERGEEQRLSHPLLRGVVNTYWRSLLILQAWNVAQYYLGLLDPLLMQQVLVFQENQNKATVRGDLTESQISRGFTAVSACITLGLFMIVFNSQRDFFQNRLNFQINSALRGVVLFRCLQGRPLGPYGMGIGSSQAVSPTKDAEKPSVYNVISFDVGPNIDIIWIILGLWLFPIQFFSSVSVLYYQVGYALVPGLVVIFVAKLIVGIMLYYDGVLRDQLLCAKDVRLRRCNEGFNSIRTLHMLSWVLPFRNRIMDARHEELRCQNLRLWMEKMTAALDYSLPVIVTAATLAYYTFEMGGELKASVALPVISLINGLTGPIGQFPVWMNQYLVWRSAYSRVNDFIGVDVNPSDTAAGEGTGTANVNPAEVAAPSDDNVAKLNDCTLMWGNDAFSQAPVLDDGDEEAATRQPLLAPDSSFTLPDLNLKVGQGEILVVVGQEAQGKSSLLFGLLGEMPSTGGSIASPAITRRQAQSSVDAKLKSLPESVPLARKLLDAEEGTACSVDPLAVPLAAQSPVLFAGHIRSNIVFGSPFKQALYARVVKACALEEDLATMPAGDLTEVAQAGATLSGGQRVRIGLARVVYRAVVAIAEQPDVTPLVLLDDPLCSLDQRVAREISQALFAAPDGLLSTCAVVVATSQPWWLPSLQSGASVAVLRAGSIFATGSPADVASMGLPEFAGISASDFTASASSAQPASSLAAPSPMQQSNPQGDDEEEAAGVAPGPLESRSKQTDSEAQTDLTDEQRAAALVIKEEHREEGQVSASTYSTYLSAVGAWRLSIAVVALTGIMVFQNLCNLWIAYWTAPKRDDSFLYPWLEMIFAEPPTRPSQLLVVYMCLGVCFTLSNFAGHAVEIWGGMAAARKLFAEALEGIFKRPFQWWDANPTGRVLNRFSEDVNVMDLAITNIMGVIFGAVLFFVGHTFILALSNPFALLLLPFIAAGLEYYARYYRMTIREIQRNFIVRMSILYQEMVEAIVGSVVLRAFAAEARTMCQSMDSLDKYQRVGFAKASIALWLGFRMALIGYVLSFWVKLRPILQYYQIVGKQSAALVGFSISYSTETVGIIQQFISNYSDLEMQLISIERLGEYARLDAQARALGRPVAIQNPARGLHLSDVTVQYRPGLPPALRGVSLSFPPRHVTAIVGRTGAGKTSLLLAILQLVPHEGGIWVDGQLLADLSPEEVRRRLVGIVPQQPVIFAGDMRRNLDPEGEHSEEAMWHALQAVGLESKCRSEGDGLELVLAADGESQGSGGMALSYGQRQLLCAARVLLRRPRAVMLDEVTASLPAELASSTVSTLVRRFREFDATVLLVTHQENLISSCGRVVTMSGGRVLDDRYTSAEGFA
mmetsp:Transcript_66871/g.116315  ORF Transcript_66871/g.116315 Transcript_66871/m.116315 type:complete len:1407 (-) Transcript_66871:44-4264(-)